MANIIVDTNGLQKTIVDASHNYASLVEKVNNLQTEIQEILSQKWSGKSSRSFLLQIQNDFKLYNSYINNLENYKLYLENFCKELEKIISQCDY